MLVFFTNASLMEFLFLVTDDFVWFSMGSIHKNIQLIWSFLRLHSWFYPFFLLYINDPPDNVICNIAIYTDDTALYFKCDLGSDLWQQLELTSEVKSDLQEIGLKQEVVC